VIAAGLLIMGSLTFLVSQDLPANAKFDWFMGLLAVSMLLVIYFLPSLAAAERKHRNLTALVDYHDCYYGLYDSQSGISTSIDCLHNRKSFLRRVGGWNEDEERDWHEKLIRLSATRQRIRVRLRRIRRRLRTLGAVLPARGPDGRLVSEFRWQEVGPEE